MAYLTSDSLGTKYRPAVEKQFAADPGTHGDDQEIVVTLRVVPPGRRDVVQDHDVTARPKVDQCVLQRKRTGVAVSPDSRSRRDHARLRHGARERNGHRDRVIAAKTPRQAV